MPAGVGTLLLRLRSLEETPVDLSTASQVVVAIRRVALEDPPLFLQFSYRQSQE
jgi:hypothetical protein